MNKKEYPPDLREYDVNKDSLKSFSKDNKDYKTLPNPKSDDIVSNNIATWEFDYTDKSLIKEEDNK